MSSMEPQSMNHIILYISKGTNEVVSLDLRSIVSNSNIMLG